VYFLNKSLDYAFIFQDVFKCNFVSDGETVVGKYWWSACFQKKKRRNMALYWALAYCM